ncbi:MAG: hypothetical protein Q8R38_02870 [Candidatus Omnitrophota bacterium]|nr:hypothetical protein [Candidatus Omnitrophota bacterium]
MCEHIHLGKNKVITAIFVPLAVIFIIICGDYAYGAGQAKESTKEFISEEDLIDETRFEVEKHLNDKEPVRAKPVAVVVEKLSSPIATEKRSVAEKTPVASEEKSSSSDEMLPVVESEPVQAEEAPAAMNQDTSQFVEERGILPSDVTPVAVQDVKKPVAEEVDFSVKDQKAAVKPALEAPLLKKMDVGKIGASPYYETYEGLRLLKYFTVAQRVEIYQEPRPIDSYILDAHAMRYLYENTPWNIKSDYRTQLTPIFTRAYGTEVTISDPKNKEGQLRYTLDYRDIYKNYFPKYQYSISGAQQAFLKKEMWEQNEILLMHSKNLEPINWLYTFNLGFRYSTMSAKSDINYTEIRNTYFSSLSLAPTDRIEYFFQGEYYKSMHVKSSFAYSPDHFLGRTEVRIKSKDYKTMFVPQFSYSKDLYYPFANSFEKYEIALRVGRDFTKRFSASSTLQYVYSFRDEPDNTAPLYAFKNPLKDKAEYISLQNRFSYNVYDRLYLQAGLDLANGLNWSIFDNLGLLGGLEYYAPGMIRIDVGWRGNYYYNLQDFMNSIYFKFYLFM